MCKQQIRLGMVNYITNVLYILNSNKVVQQRLKENDESLAAQKSENSEVKQREKLVQKEMTDLKKRVRELCNNLTAKETELHNLHSKFHEHMQKEYCSGTDQSHIKLNTLYLSI